MKDYLELSARIPLATIQRVSRSNKQLDIKLKCKVVRDYAKNLRIKPTCDECRDKQITEKVYNHSMNKYNRALCWDCQQRIGYGKELIRR
jgi:hypothetical protein